MGIFLTSPQQGVWPRGWLWWCPYFCVREYRVHRCSFWDMCHCWKQSVNVEILRFCSESPQGKMLRRCLPTTCFPGKPLLCCWSQQGALGELAQHPSRWGGPIRDVPGLPAACVRSQLDPLAASVAAWPTPWMWLQRQCSLLLPSTCLEVSLLGNPTPHFFLTWFH